MEIMYGTKCTVPPYNNGKKKLTVRKQSMATHLIYLQTGASECEAHQNIYIQKTEGDSQFPSNAHQYQS